MTSPKKEFLHKTHDQVLPAAYGSIHERKVNPDLQEERDKCNFDQAELTKVIYGNNVVLHKDFSAWVQKEPLLQAGPAFYDMTREEQMERAQKVMKFIASDKDNITLH
jgi:hypothetical protein